MLSLVKVDKIDVSVAVHLLYIVNVMLVYMQAVSVNTQKKLVWTRKLGDGGRWRQEQYLSCRQVFSRLGIF